MLLTVLVLVTLVARLKLLRSLAIGERWGLIGGWSAYMDVGALARLGVAFPELASLRVSSMVMDYLVARPPSEDGAAAWAPLPALRQLAIESTGKFFDERRLLRSAQLHGLLSRIAAAAEGLETLELAPRLGARHLRPGLLPAARRRRRRRWRLLAAPPA